MTPSTTRLLVKTTSKLSSLSIRPSPRCGRAFSQTCLRQQDDEKPPAPPKPPASKPSILAHLSTSLRSNGPPPRRSGSGNSGTYGMQDVKRVLATGTISRAMNRPHADTILDNSQEPTEDWGPKHEPFHFHIYSHKHNTHITVTKPNRNAILSMSAGNIGFRKTKRGTYDAAYQLCAYVIDKLNQGGWHRKITALEVVLRGFGPGREAATKVLLGNEGRLLRPFIKSVSDSTRLKFGGTRSPKPRRLG
ncbi:putative mitochondrial ribosomal protein subunit s18 [Rosellinia necatrix]|uniref:Putative mitochondrial ribosomal protein subunit s18 n=1 Tax=Rosellinia necatrix TaxID=77044 RepID=A0A1S7UI57_ROSNE|nr:putative mitochondrial ribosomal protein subunit s18 [Rosellinia necatrix]